MVGGGGSHVVRRVSDCGHVRHQVGWCSGGPVCIARTDVVGWAVCPVGLRGSSPSTCSLTHGGIVGASTRRADVAGLGGTHVHVRSCQVGVSVGGAAKSTLQ